MDLQAWRQKQQEGEEVELPSGLVVQMVRVGMIDLALRGDVPAPLVAAVNEVMAKGISNLTVENAAEYEGPINLVTKAAVVNPPVKDKADEHSLGVNELPMVDRLAIFRYCNRYGEQLRPFRRESTSPVEPA
ncbi:MAG: hypothetical protein JXR84_15710 [Anaerolineae bacterium]|nr:hypothetical protein [Anaerolineae bacterium]